MRKRKKHGIYEKYVKRPQDFCCALAATIVLSPVMAVTALLVRLKLGSPVIFKQERPGLNGKIFTLYKFRTMTDEKDADGNYCINSSFAYNGNIGSSQAWFTSAIYTG